MLSQLDRVALDKVERQLLSAADISPRSHHLYCHPRIESPYVCEVDLGLFDASIQHEQINGLLRTRNCLRITFEG